VAVPEDMFAGVVGVAPSPERLEQFRAREKRLREAGQAVADALPASAMPASAVDGLRTIPPRETGGNLDVRQLIAGSRVWLPSTCRERCSRSVTSTSPRATARNGL